MKECSLTVGYYRLIIVLYTLNRKIRLASSRVSYASVCPLDGCEIQNEMETMNQTAPSSLHHDPDAFMLNACSSSIKSLVSGSSSDRDRPNDTSQFSGQRRGNIDDDRSKNVLWSLSQSTSNPSKDDMKKHSSLVRIPQDLQVLNDMACWRVFSCGNLKSSDFTADADFLFDSQDECGFEIGEDGYEIQEHGPLLHKNYGMNRV
jgi:hypothetical protein